MDRWVVRGRRRLWRPMVGATGLVGVMTASACGPPDGGADLVLTGGRIWTGATSPHAADGPTALAVRDGRILAVGSDEAVLRLARPDTRVVPLEGRRVLPGFMDSHTHFLEGGFSLAGVQLRDADTPEEFTRRIAVHAAAHPGEWVRRGAWDHERWGGELPRRDWIDSVTPDTPVFVSRLDQHMALANTRALELAGITADTPDPPGGTIERYPDGRPAGVLKDAAQDLVFRVIPEPTEAEQDRALGAAAAHAVSRGVTMVTDMGSWSGLETYRRAHHADRLPLRVYSVVPVATWERLRAFIDTEGRGDARLFWGGVKAFVDGSLGSTTAWFYEPYADAPETTGLIVVPDSGALRTTLLAAGEAGLHLIVHAIGDRANDWTLDVFRAAQGTAADPRHRVEHAQHLTVAGIRRFAEQRVIASMQPYHAIDDGRWAENRIGPERLETTYAFRDLIDAGVRVTFGSDWTVAPIDPLLGIYAAVTRRTLDGAHPGGWVPRQKITVAEAVAAYTADNAYGAFLERELGTIEPGKLADVVVLSDDIFAIDPVAIETVRVDLTFVEGREVFAREAGGG